MSDRLNLGCGNEILPNWVNHDLAQLPGVDVVHDLTSFPWPFADGQFEMIRAFHVLEHLPETVRTIEELHRICAPGGRVHIRVPYWNSPDMIADPTHKVSFSEATFDFFDPHSPRCQERPYYSIARFAVSRMDFYVKLRTYILVRNPWAKAVLTRLARHLGGIIWVLEVELTAVKP